MFFDGSLNIDDVGVGFFFVSPNKDKLCYILRILFPTSVINQLNKERDTTHEKMDLYCKEIRKWEANFYGIKYIHVVRDKNQATNALSKIGSSWAQIPQSIFV